MLQMIIPVAHLEPEQLVNLDQGYVFTFQVPSCTMWLSTRITFTDVVLASISHFLPFTLASRHIKL